MAAIPPATHGTEVRLRPFYIRGLTVRGDGFGWANDRDALKLTPSVEEEQAEGCRPRKGRWRGGGDVTSHAGVLRTTVKGWTKGHVACEG